MAKEMVTLHRDTEPLGLYEAMKVVVRLITEMDRSGMARASGTLALMREAQTLTMRFAKQCMFEDEDESAKHSGEPRKNSIEVEPGYVLLVVQELLEEPLDGHGGELWKPDEEDDDED